MCNSNICGLTGDLDTVYLSASLLCCLLTCWLRAGGRCQMTQKKTSTVISPTRDSKYFGQKASMWGIHFGRSVSVHAEVTSMSAQFIISRPLTPPVYWGPRIKKAHSEHTEKGKRSAVRALNIQLDKGGKGGGGEVELRASPSCYITD